jgi:transaldolase
MTNPALGLARLGQSLWIDYLDRGRIVSGEVQRHIDEDGLRGMTSNPSIFEKAITSDPVYDQPIRDLARAGRTAGEIYQAITVQDVQLAADIFRPVFDRLDGRDGFVSLEVSPRLAHDTRGTIAEARSLWAAIGRPNAMIKVPATRAGLPAIRQLIREGINVNVTLLFGLERYDEVAAAWLSGLEARAASRQPVRVASVASFFLSRIDVLVDARLNELERAGQVDPARAARLRGQVAIASARLAYLRYRRLVAGERFQALAAQGAFPQRLLWASTSTKDPASSDVKYLDALIGPETITTVPPETLNAYRDHGRPALRLEEHLVEAQEVLEELGRTGIELGLVSRRLEDEGVRRFVESYERLLRALAERCAAALRPTAGAEEVR